MTRTFAEVADCTGFVSADTCGRLRTCVRSRIVRAFLIEEQKCVKQVLAEKLSQKKEDGRKGKK